MTPVETHSDGDSIACPWCGAELTGLNDYRWMPGDGDDKRCDGCDRPFWLRCRTTWTASRPATEDDR